MVMPTPFDESFPIWKRSPAVPRRRSVGQGREISEAESDLRSCMVRGLPSHATLTCFVMSPSARRWRWQVISKVELELLTTELNLNGDDDILKSGNRIRDQFLKAYLSWDASRRADTARHAEDEESSAVCGRDMHLDLAFHIRCMANPHHPRSRQRPSSLRTLPQVGPQLSRVWHAPPHAEPHSRV